MDTLLYVLHRQETMGEVKEGGLSSLDGAAALHQIAFALLVMKE